eukprot:scaffold5868_cov120-Isochrysis_galbana.AAC.11
MRPAHWPARGQTSATAAQPPLHLRSAPARHAAAQSRIRGCPRPPRSPCSPRKAFLPSTALDGLAERQTDARADVPQMALRRPVKARQLAPRHLSPRARGTRPAGAPCRQIIAAAEARGLAEHIAVPSDAIRIQ